MTESKTKPITVISAATFLDGRRETGYCNSLRWSLMMDFSLSICFLIGSLMVFGMGRVDVYVAVKRRIAIWMECEGSLLTPSRFPRTYKIRSMTKRSHARARHTCTVNACLTTNLNATPRMTNFSAVDAIIENDKKRHHY